MYSDYYNFYNKESEAGIIYNDKTLKIDWQFSTQDLIVSEKDKTITIDSKTFSLDDSTNEVSVRVVFDSVEYSQSKDAKLSYNVNISAILFKVSK